MNGPIAQAVALTCHANANLRGIEIDDFFPTNSSCQFCEYVRFVASSRALFGRARNRLIAPTPEAWFSTLRTESVLGVRLGYANGNDPTFSDRMLAGLVGVGGRWCLEVLRSEGKSEFLCADWEVHNQNAPDRRIWRVAYRQVAARSTVQQSDPDLEATTIALAEAVRDVHAFATSHDLAYFAESFAEALDTVDSAGARLHGYHQDLAPQDSISQSARALIDACQRAWVFGGMGSWNDMGFDEPHQAKYEQISERLYRSVIEAILAAANQSCRH